MDDWRIFLEPPALLPLPAAILVLAWSFVVGAALGSFLNVVIARVPAGLSVVKPRSRCPKCQKHISGFDNIPVASWFILRGKCRSCQAPISFRYPFIEMLMGLVAMAAVARFGLGVQALELYTLTAILTAIAFIDLDTWTVPLSLGFALIVAGLAFGGVHAFVLHDDELGLGKDLFVDRVIGAASAGIFLSALVVASTAILRRIGTRVENGVKVKGRVGPNDYAMGWGDPLILVGVGAFLGWRVLPLVVFLASFQGSVVALGLMALSKLRPGTPGLPQGDKPVSEEDDWIPPKNAVPFGPFLALAALQAAFFGDALLGQLLPMLGFAIE